MMTELERKRMMEYAAYGTPITEEELNKRFMRVAGDIACSYCGKPFGQHPVSGEALKLYPDLVLVEICDGTLGKL
jgi:hypothetical protein